MKRTALLLTLMLTLAALTGVLTAGATPGAVELAGIDGFANGCDPGINVAGFTVRFNVAGDVTVRAQAYTDFYDDTVVIGATGGGGALVSFTMNAPALPEHTVIQYTISNGDPDNAIYVSVDCTSGTHYLERLLGADGRLYAGEDLPVVIYPKLDRDGNPYLDFYSVDANSRGRRTLRVTAAMIEAAGERPTRNTQLGVTRDGWATLYRLTSGEFQVNYLPDFEGKVRVVRFDAVSPTRVVRDDVP